MQREPRTFASKAWSGSSLVAGTSSMFAAFVKAEQSLPSDERELQKRVQDSIIRWLIYTQQGPLDLKLLAHRSCESSLAWSLLRRTSRRCLS